MASSLTHGPLGDEAVHICVDMQRLFGPESPWGVPWAQKVLPAIRTLASFHAQRTIFTRFIPPADLSQAHGNWSRYYAKWPEVLGHTLPPEILGLLPELAEFVPPALVKDKQVYSPWHDGQLHRHLRDAGIETVVVSGGETDICVLATLLGAIDLGYRTILVDDALCSSSDESHDATLTICRTRFSQQVETVGLVELLDAWKV